MNINTGKYLFFVIFSIVGFQYVYAQERGIGLRLGDPTGVTYKVYFNGDRALEFGIGTVPKHWHYSYYSKSFETFDKYEDYRYISHRLQSTLYLQGRYLIHNDPRISDIQGKFTWYWGFGALLKVATVRYHYQLTDLPPRPVDTDEHNDIDLGPEGIIGAEYTFEDLPISVFGEISLMIELADRPAALRVPIGVGVRYNF